MWKEKGQKDSPYVCQNQPIIFLIIHSLVLAAQDKKCCRRVHHLRNYCPCVRKLEVIWLDIHALPRRSPWKAKPWMTYAGKELLGQLKSQSSVKNQPRFFPEKIELLKVAWNGKKALIFFFNLGVPGGEEGEINGRLL